MRYNVKVFYLFVKADSLQNCYFSVINQKELFRFRVLQVTNNFVQINISPQPKRK